jgi:exosortase
MTDKCSTEQCHGLVFFLLLAASLIFGWHPLVTTFHLAVSSDAHTHILMIVPLSAALIYLDRKLIRRPFPWSVEAGVALLLMALIIAGATKWFGTLPDDVRVSVSMFALVSWWLGSVILCFGTRVFRAFLFPMCFLLLVVPIPESALNGIIASLQEQSAFTARMLFHLAGVPVRQEGVVLSIPGLDLEVAKECSSIRSSLILVITTMVLAFLLLRSWWRKSLLVAAAVPLTFIKNGLRIFVIAELGTQVDAGFLNGWLHHNGGIIFLTVAIAAVVALLWILRRTEVSSPANA